MGINPKKLSRIQLSEMIQRMIQEAIEEAGPPNIGYLNKKGAPNLSAWGAQPPASGETPPPPAATKAPVGPTGISGDTTGEEVVSAPDKTVAPLSRQGAPQQPTTIAGVTTMLQNASKEQLEQIRALLAQKPPV